MRLPAFSPATAAVSSRFARVRTPALLGAALTLAIAAGCGGGAPTPVVGPGPASSGSTSGPKVVVNEDRTPVDGVPAGTIVEAHFMAPKKILKHVQSWMPGAPAIDARSALSDIAGSELARVIDLDAPVDFALTVPVGKGKNAFNDMHGAVAFGVANDVDVASVVKGSYVAEVAPNGFIRLVRAKGGAGDTECGVAPSLGATKYRLVCAFADRGSAAPALAELYPYMARGVTRQPEPAAAVHAKVDVAMFRTVLGADLAQGRAELRAVASGEVRFEKAALQKVGRRIAEDIVEDMFDLVDDTSAVTLDLIGREQGVETQLGFSFTTAKSWTARALMSASDVTGGTPTFLGKLPAASLQIASWSKASPAADALIGPVQKAAVDLVNAFAEDYKVAAKDRDVLLDLVKLVSLRSVDSAAAFLGEAHGAHALGETSIPAVLRYLTRRSTVVGVEDRPIKDVIAKEKILADALSRPAFAQLLSAIDRSDLKLTVKRKDLPLKGLPKGSFAQRLELTLTGGDKHVEPPAPGGAKGKKAPAPKAKPTIFTYDQIVVADGANRTWVASGWGVDDAVLTKDLIAAMEGKSMPALSGRLGFEELAAQLPLPTSTAAMMTVRWIFDEIAHLDGKSPKEMSKDLEGLPDKGQGYFLFKVGGKHAGNGGASMLDILVPRDLLAAWFVLRKGGRVEESGPVSVPPAVP